jgi:hypothetical protein
MALGETSRQDHCANLRVQLRLATLASQLLEGCKPHVQQKLQLVADKFKLLWQCVDLTSAPAGRRP